VQQSDSNRTICVIGAGPAGLATAYTAVKKGADVLVLEESNRVGGLSASISLWGQTVDLGPHRFFTNDERVNALWRETLDFREYSLVKRMTRIYYGGKFYHYPLELVDVLRNLGVVEAARCIASYLKEFFARSSGKPDTFESWVTRRFGKRLFELFFKSYTEKLWAVPCSELDADFAAQRIRKLSLWNVVSHALKGRSFTGHRTLVDQFAYPWGGTGAVYEKMAEKAVALGATIRMQAGVVRILTEGRKVVAVELKNGERVRVGAVASTMPLTLLVKALGDVVPKEVTEAAAALAFRSTTLVYLKIDSSNLFPDNWIYIHSPELRVGRITNFRNWVPQINNGHPETILTLEYWSNPGDGFADQSNETLIQLAASELQQTGLLGAAKILDGHVVRIPRSYPLYRRNYKTHLNIVARFLDTFENLLVLGRYGSFKYNNQDHSLLMGILASERFVDGVQNDLWGVNSDYDTYQEAQTCGN